mmetsp:Transcript_183888/g.583273  ORF Transcript_183888/g.583273 Transcript_183888/m.583273 type:complete len:95 (+) Transcript_183888:434-718(+)
MRASQKGENMYFVTKRRIKAGEELMIDYGPQYWPGLRYQTRTHELNREVQQLKTALNAVPKGDRRKREDLEARLARCRWDAEALEEGSDAESDD